MNKDHWAHVDAYFNDRLLRSDEVLEAALQSNAEASLPEIDVSPAQGMMLHLMAKAASAEKILEIGTLGGYSTICLARALPAHGSLVTLELEPVHAAVAQGNLERAGVSEQVEIRVGPALDTLAQLIDEGLGPFDFIFIDADKEQIVAYFDAATKLSRAGSTIVVDNVVRNGAVIDRNSEDSRVQGVRRFVESLKADQRVSATVVQTVGAKGYDGFVLAVVNE